MTRLPTIYGDDNIWGTVLNGYLSVAHNANGTSYTVTTVTSNYTISSESPANVNEFILVNANSNSITITLPDATSSTFNTFLYTIKRIDSTYPTHTVSINTTSSQTIDGSTTVSIKVQYVSISVVSDGSNWNVV